MPPRAAIASGYLLAFLLLSGLTWGLWQYRYEAIPDEPALTLGHTRSEVMRVPFSKLEGGDGKEPLRLKAGAETPRLEFRWREQPHARFAHVRMETSCQGVELGKQRWDEARIALLWIDANGKLAPDYLPLWGGYGDQVRAQHDIVVPLARHGTLPKFSISNDGRAGELAVYSFSVQPVQWRGGMIPAAILLVAGWLGWAAWGIRRWVAGEGTGLVRIVAGAGLWVVFGWYSSMPGPWIPFHPLGESFPIQVVPAPVKILVPAPPPVAANPAATPEVTTPAPAPPPAAPVAAAAPQPLPSAAEGAPEGTGGGPMRWLLLRVPALKKVAHFAGFAVLAALLGLLAGSKRAMWPALVLGALSEFGQWAFGFGFGWDDVLDLALDTVSVLAGIAVWQALVKWRRRSKAKAAVAEPQSSTASI